MKQFVHIEGHDKLYPCNIIGEWNGYAVPEFSKETMQDFILHQPTGDGFERFEMLESGDVVITDDQYKTDETIRLNNRGMYTLSLGYCFIGYTCEDKGREYLIRSMCGRKSVITDSTLLNHGWDLTQRDVEDNCYLAEWIEAGRDMDHDFVTDDGDRITKLN